MDGRSAVVGHFAGPVRSHAHRGARQRVAASQHRPQPHGDPPRARRAAQDPGNARAAGGLGGGARNGCGSISRTMVRWTSPPSRRIEEEVNEHVWAEPAGRRPASCPTRKRSRPGRWPSSPRSTATSCASWTSPGVSLELCGGTHVDTTGEIALFRFTHETGSQAGVRRIEAITGPAAYRLARDLERRLGEASAVAEDAAGAPERIASSRCSRRTASSRSASRTCCAAGGGEARRARWSASARSSCTSTSRTSTIATRSRSRWMRSASKTAQRHPGAVHDRRASRAFTWPSPRTWSAQGREGRRHRQGPGREHRRQGGRAAALRVGGCRRRGGSWARRGRRRRRNRPEIPAVVTRGRAPGLARRAPSGPAADVARASGPPWSRTGPAESAGSPGGRRTGPAGARAGPARGRPRAGARSAGGGRARDLRVRGPGRA